MKNIAFAVLFGTAVLSFAGCKKKGAGEGGVAKVTEYKEKMCKCKAGEKDCAEGVMKEMMEYGKANKAETDKWKNDEALKKKVEPISTAMMDCYKAATGTVAGGTATDTGSTPPATPDTAGSAAGSAAAPTETK